MQEVKMSKRLLCLDVGDKKIGVAVSDPFGHSALGLTTIQRKNFESDCQQILKFIEEYNPAKIIIGLPLNADDKEGAQAKKVRFFAEGFEKFLAINNHQALIKLYDESFSSKEAEKTLVEANLSRKKRKKVIDQLAAILILESYLRENG